MLLLSAGLGAWGLRYGLPSVYTWAQDEIIPAEVLEGLEQRFAHGWHSRYPPLHYGLMALAYAPVRAVSAAPAVTHDSRTYERLFVAGRALSLLMALGTLALLYRSAVLTVGRGAAPFAALCLALSPTFVYYSKFANLDVPYLFWFAASLYLLLRFLRTRAAGDVLLSAAAAAASIATKDQAYALFALLPPLVIAAVLDARRAETGDGSLSGALRDERVLLPALAAILIFVSAHNLVWNASGFAAHLRLITGDAIRDYRMFARDVAGEWQLAKLCGRLIVFVLGEPASLLALVGLIVAAYRRERLLLVTLLPILSSQLLFLGVVLYAYDRFLLPHAFVLALFAARAFAAVGGVLRGAAVAAVLAFGLLRCVSLDLLLEHDSRYAVERWFLENVPRGERIAVVGTLEYMPRLHGFNWKQRSELLRAVEGMNAEYVVVNADYAARAEDPRAKDLYGKLGSGEAGYGLALAARTSLSWPFRLDAYVRRRGDALPTNLDKINPEIRVYRRAPAR